ncbi:hypothetical protein K435DRAFT_719916 [Dendrothele bispora CBS 962.96]|uniref:BTB domain-containing protein n=1 Tax=Dendrothele bispora (strain CBS 962.96) TaxID=1314807 RepID=A0A4S8MA41_DENBC|nr:hypothetical protein K435DRAFT_719916 [Dendrothele bispora CBS 962.96]
MSEAPKVSKFFHAESGGDVIFRSSDNVLFHVQQKYLELYSESFPLTEQVILSKDIVPLSESSSVLELLFQFTYPHIPPDLDDLDFRTLMDLAEAAEKYLIHHCRRICAIHMRSFVSQHNDEIFAFAAKHDYIKLLYDLAPTLVTRPLLEIVHLLPPSLYIPWSLYHDQWTSLLLTHFKIPCSCSSRNSMYNTREIREILVEWLEAGGTKTLELPNLRVYCCDKWFTWKEDLQNNVHELRVRDFQSFVKEYKNNSHS